MTFRAWLMRDQIQQVAQLGRGEQDMPGDSHRSMARLKGMGRSKVSQEIREIAKRLAREQRGQVLVEFALVLPIVVMLMLAIITGGWSVAVDGYVSNLARVGATAAAQAGGDTSVVQPAVDAKAGMLSTDSIQINAEEDLGTPRVVTVCVSYPTTINYLFGTYGRRPSSCDSEVVPPSS